MEIIVHRGTHQIGGCVTEICSNNGTRIAIDIGENLPTIENSEEFEGPELIKVEGLTKEKKKRKNGDINFDAVFVTHYHGDHIGLYNKILPSIPIYIGESSKEIYRILCKRLVEADFVSEDDLKIVNEFKTFKIPEKIKIKDDIVITPIEVDHSAFNAHMFLVECDGKKILHTGDFRTHGQRGRAVIKALEKYVGKVDCLICEGTTLSRKKGVLLTEMELQYKAERLFKENKYNFVLCSSTNIDRIAAIHKATLKAGRLFVCDSYQKEILMYIDSISRSKLYKFKNRVLSYGTNIFDLMKNKGFVMLVRDNYISNEVMKKFPESKFIYSQWEGYLNEKFTQYESLQKFVPKDHVKLHTSGHADFTAIRKVCQTVEPNIIIPIHGENPENFRRLRT